MRLKLLKFYVFEFIILYYLNFNRIFYSIINKRQIIEIININLKKHDVKNFIFFYKK